ncbi:hypothetical protein ACOMHN_054097 [Nucella lapillus]
MQRARSATLPAILANLVDVHVQGIWSETWAQERFVLHADNDWGILVFATDENLQHLRQCSTVYMDGTFKSCPRPYNQVFTIFGNLNGFVIPFVHVLMAERTIGHYRQALQAVKTGVRRSTHHNWRPRLIVSDFELALRTAIETELPATRIGGCYFHFNQALWRKIQELGLSAPYQQNQRLKEVIRKVMAIGYLPLAVVYINFTALVGARRIQRLTARYPQLADFLTYVSNTYVRHRATFPPPVWNVYDRRMDQRTNNHVEAFHRRLNDAVQVRHPTLWMFIRLLKDNQTLTEDNMSRADRGDAAPRRRRKWRQLDERLTQLKQEFHDGDRDLDAYWRAVSHCMMEAV